MILIGENIHIISKAVSEAVRERNPVYIQELARAQAKAGADLLDLNLGPARKDPDAAGSWLVNTVQEVTDLPVSLDTMNPLAMEAGLKLCKKRPLLNSTSGKSESKESMMPLAVKYNTQVVISVITDLGCPPDVDSRVESIMDTVAHANGLGIQNEDIFVDPIILPVSADQKQVREALEFIKILPDLLPGVKSVVGLSNVSNGTPAPLRGILNRTYMLMLEINGLYSAIADVLDPELIELNQGGQSNIRELVRKVMEGEAVILDGLAERERDYVKTARVLMGEALYSHAWLEA
jgi:cobalamin-dependent methionine synthase I